MEQKKRLRFYLDTEFSERPGSIELISIGIVCDNNTFPLGEGSTFYAESTSFNPDNCNEWVKENVLTRLKFKDADKQVSPYRINKYVGEVGPEIEMYGPIEKIKELLLEWIRTCCNTKGGAFPEFWAYFADYDWVVFCWIFGTMMELPEAFPKYCLDLKQEMHRLGLSKEWKQKNAPEPEGEHNALEDARWNHRLHSEIRSYELLSKDPDAR